MAALSQSLATTSHLPSSANGALVVQRTEVAPTTPDYRQIDIGGPSNRTETGAGERPHPKPVRIAEPAQLPAAAKRESVRGVVDHIEGGYARATLFYAGRQNPFLFDAHDFFDAGVAYPGALFEIIIGSDLGYTIVHSVEEEAAARNAARPPNLAFLDEE